MKKVFQILLMVALCVGCHKKNSTTSSGSENGPAEDNITTATTSSENRPAENKDMKVQPVPEAEEKTKHEEIKWMTYEEAVKASKKKPKKIFIDVYTDWCGWCKKMDKSTMKDPKIADYMNKKFYAVKLNAESDKMLTFQNKQISERELAGRVFKITGYPTTVYLESNEKIIQPIPGFMDVANLDKILHYIGEDYYKTQTWEQFQMSYTGE